MSQPVRTVSPSGERIVILAEDAYDHLIELAEDRRDGRVSDQALADDRAGRTVSVSGEEMREFLAAPTKLQFWRRKRGLSQQALADKVGCSKPYLTQLEAGRRAGSVATWRKLAAALHLPLKQISET